jgi:hypothetical protein
MEEERLRNIKNGLLADQKTLQEINERLLGDQEKIKDINARLLGDQEKIKDINERLLSDQEKIRQATERELRGASLIYRRDDPVAQRQIRELARLATPVGVKSLKKIRVGRIGDGGYVMIDDFKDIRTAFSLGIGGDVSWDLDIARRGIRVMQYDHSVAHPPQQHENFMFHRKMIGAEKNESSESLASVLRDYGEPGRGNILKIDIEGAEWDVLDSAPIEELDRFHQIVGEFHDFEEVYDTQWYNRAVRVMAKLLTRFAVAHVHGSNTGRLAVLSNLALPTALEITFLNKADHEFEQTDEIYPTELDSPTDPAFADIFLGNFRF